MTLEKKYKSSVLSKKKNDACMSGFTFVSKTESPCKKLFSVKKILPADLGSADKIFKTDRGNLFKINQSHDISTFGNFMVFKSCSSQYIINKKQKIKKFHPSFWRQLLSKEISARQDYTITSGALRVRTS